jgi:hypothetical protein
VTQSLRDSFQKVTNFFSELHILLDHLCAIDMNTRSVLLQNGKGLWIQSGNPAIR